MLRNMPMISVIIPVYQVESYIRQALESIVSQTYRNLQIILVDDGSTDNSGKICDEYAQKDDRVSVIHKENGGVSSARNVGLSLAEGEWIHFMDPDDWLEFDAYEKIMKNATQTGADMVFFGNEVFDRKNKTYGATLRMIDKRVQYHFKSLESFDTFLIYGSDGTVCMCVIRKNVIKSHVRFPDSLVMNEDYAFRLTVYPFIKSFSFLPDVLYHCRRREGSATRNGNWEAYLRNMEQAYRIHCEILKNPGYPTNAVVAVNTNYLNLMLGLLDTNVIRNPIYTYREKKKMIDAFARSDIYLECITAYDSRVMRRANKMVLRHKNLNLPQLLFMNWMKWVKHCFDKWKRKV